MKSTLKFVTIWWAIFCLIGCTSMQTVSNSAPHHEVEFKDRIVVYERGGRIIDMQVVSIDETKIVGSLTNAPLQAVTTLLADVEKIEIESVDGGKTTLAVVGGIILLPFLILALMIGIADSVD
ncbi:hypothetical protein [Pleionea litopenaei]|uniref:Lipoprotein n=1 Tax=Pleionea litopenaei TaxID=3070815 RepID=A0AA51RTG8_9GAMM|nr:hypothetical protein [Pleionea sp. HL-JVS1]WMS87179.1 hypothetical protein Q9312_18395 [Pleionea sp. HL-JVS1]